MTALVARLVSGRMHFGWIAAAVAFLVLLAAAGVRATPSVLIVPLEQSFGWSRETISFAIGVNIFLYGLMGPFAAAAMQRFGIRPVIIFALALLAVAVSGSTLITQEWQLVLTWGLLVGFGSGIAAMVFGATIVNRWFQERRGLVMGLLTASTATGSLVFLPILAAVAEDFGWQPVAWVVAVVVAAMIPLVFLLLPERPQDVGLSRLGEAPGAAPAAATGNPILTAFRILGRASRKRDFWLLAGSFFVCGLTTNGLIGTHLISACIDQGIPATTGAALLAAMGIFDLIGTTASGWLSDRYSSRWLLFWYYGLRGLSLIYLPFSGFSFYGLSVFAVFYGLDWIATVPPTLKLTNDAFGKDDAPVVFGWIAASHQVGAATAAFGAGVIRTAMDGYLLAFLIAGVICVGAAFMVLAIGRGQRPAAGRLVEATA
ncbi:MFS transporter [Inquilinus limosus]|uniref:MFS transporter n=1 Tax=Inquilinus limosus MP06 TaxID=1398085 RepID=A0A0A0D526_9PROT|nr:MFS transporter [Inquilinus limosus]KGM32888.1 MFS transporter [Inquilinus limosus MP06]